MVYYSRWQDRPPRKPFKRPFRVGDVVKRNANSRYESVYRNVEYIVTQESKNSKSLQQIRLVRTDSKFSDAEKYWLNAENFDLVKAADERDDPMAVLQNVAVNATYIIVDEKGSVVGSTVNPTRFTEEIRAETDQLDSLVQSHLRLNPDAELSIYSLEKRAKLPPLKVVYTYDQPAEKATEESKTSIADEWSEQSIKRTVELFNRSEKAAPDDTTTK